MAVQRAGQTIKQTILSWPGMHALPHRFGGTELQYGTREIGHIHGDHLVDLPFPTRVRDELIANGQASVHHILPDSGWVSFYLHQPEDVARAVALFRRSFEIASKQRPIQAVENNS